MNIVVTDEMILFLRNSLFMSPSSPETKNINVVFRGGDGGYACVCLPVCLLVCLLV